VNPPEIAEQMGHSLQTLLSTYVHVMSKERQSATDLIREARRNVHILVTQRVAEAGSGE